MPKKSKLALSMILKDDSESEVLYRCLSSIARYVDGIYVTITGKSFKKIEKIIEAFGGKVSFYAWDKSFERARNYALDQIPEEFTYVIWSDADDVWDNAKALPSLIGIMENQGLTSIYFDYNYQINPTTKEIEIVHPRERIIKLGYYRWKGNLHETLIPQREVNNAYFKDVKVNHYPLPQSGELNLQRNLEILEQSYKEEGDNHDPRTVYYLARNLFDVEELDRAEKLFRDYLESSGWDEERAMAQNYLGLIGLYKREFDKAKAGFLGAISEKPNFPTWYVNMAYMYAVMGQFDDATHYARLFVATPQPDTSMVLIPIDDKMRYYETIYLVAMGERKLKEARDAIKAMLEIFPDNEEYKKKLKGLNRLDELIEVTKGVDYIAKELDREKETEKIVLLLHALPTTIEDNAVIEQLKQKYLKPKVWEEKSIVYYAGKSMEEWTPESVKSGLGGSESAIVNLSKEWVKLGYKVTVYGNCGGREGTYEGVTYHNYYRFNKYDTFDTLIIWRAPWELDFKWKAARVYLDLHDVINPLEITEERIKQVDKIFVKSQYHRDMIPHVTDDKVVIISNGFDKELCKWNHVKRDPSCLIYASSYDRGLQEMLTFGWPIIKASIPGAELHIYYGWNLFDAVHRNNPERMMWKKKMVELMSQPGITEHGRIGHDKLMEVKSKSGIHWYATTFEEIDCISVRESAAVGCIPVTTNYAALKEKDYVVRVDGDPYAKGTHEEIARKIVSLIKTKQDALRLEFKEKARRESWKAIAAKWIEYVET